MRKAGVLTALVMATFLSVPLGGALPLDFDPNARPYPAAATFTDLDGNPDTAPDFMEPFGWDCAETRPWGPYLDTTTGTMAMRVEVTCLPPLPPLDWCGNPILFVTAVGIGQVAGEEECGTLSASCTAAAGTPPELPGADECIEGASGLARGQLVCRATVRGSLTHWSVRCTNDP